MSCQPCSTNPSSGNFRSRIQWFWSLGLAQYTHPFNNQCQWYPWKVRIARLVLVMALDSLTSLPCRRAKPGASSCLRGRYSASRRKTCTPVVLPTNRIRSPHESCSLEQSLAQSCWLVSAAWLSCPWPRQGHQCRKKQCFQDHGSYQVARKRHFDPYLGAWSWRLYWDQSTQKHASSCVPQARASKEDPYHTLTYGREGRPLQCSEYYSQRDGSGWPCHVSPNRFPNWYPRSYALASGRNARASTRPRSTHRRRHLWQVGSASTTSAS